MNKISLTRDGVCVGDDMDSHKVSLPVEEDWKIKRILEEIDNINYLPQIGGGKATWSVTALKPLAVITQQQKEPLLICGDDFPHQETDEFEKIESLHFTYHVQNNPNLVFDKLKHSLDK